MRLVKPTTIVRTTGSLAKQLLVACKPPVRVRVLPTPAPSGSPAMEFDDRSFANHFPDVVEAIASSAAVVLDVELSGVSRKKVGVQRDSPQSLEERYAEIREAAQKYGILQLGITILQSLDPECARARTYNINLNPLISQKTDLGLDRDIAIQSSAIQFLANNGFNIAEPFTKGVRFLSRDEEATARERVLARLEPKQKRPPLQLADHEKAAKGIVTDAREEIRKRADALRAGTEQLSILPAHSKFTSFHRFLIFNLIEDEFPDLSAYTLRDNGSVVVGVRKEDRSKRMGKQQSWRHENDTREINRHIGFRWIVEALCSSGGKLKDLDLDSFPESPYREAETERAKKAIKDLRMRQTPVIIVGHNVFNDLVYLIQWFLEELPETAVDFQKVVHKFFPLVLDTKYMATHDWVHGEIYPDSSLENVFQKLNGEADCAIDKYEGFWDFIREATAHQAGYDSYISACALLLMCRKFGIDKGDDGRAALESYFNKLRIFGTGKASMMDLDPNRQPDPLPPRNPVKVELRFKSQRPPPKSKNGKGSQAS